MIDLAVCTSVWGDYSKYLGAWADSLINQDVQPALAVILDAGVASKAKVFDAQKWLEDNGIPCLVRYKKFTSVGAARNAAVSPAQAEWIIHLDADDELLPTAIADIEKVAEDHDVVSVGAIREGKLQCFPDITAEKILNGEHGMFSCGAFRKSFWCRRKWHTHNDWVDSTFWVGLAHLGARFTGIDRPGFIYNQHTDSISHRLTRAERKAAMRQWVNACKLWTLTTP